jgi:hypothetical protein
MSLVEILEIDRERLRREKVVYNTVYDRLKNRINNHARVGSKYCVYTIPEFLIGYPLVKVDKTMIYLRKKLSKEGFISFEIDSCNIFVTWDPEEIRKLNKIYKNYTGESVSEKIESVTERSFVRDNDDLIQSLIQSKMNN